MIVCILMHLIHIVIIWFIIIIIIKINLLFGSVFMKCF